MPALQETVVKTTHLTAALAILLIGSPRVFAQVEELARADVKSTKPTPRTADGHPDFNGYWKSIRGTITGNIGKDLPGMKLPLTPAGEAALQQNLTATIDPESLCVIGRIARQHRRGQAFGII